MVSIATRQVHLINRPQGAARASDFRVVGAVLPDLVDGQVLVKNLWMSVDPYMRRSMSAEATDLEPWPLNKALDGPSVGRVVESRNAAFVVGDLVESMSGWQEYFVSNAAAFVPYLSPSDSLAKRSAKGAEAKDYIGLLGVAALTAYRGMVHLARVNPGETAVVSSGAGTVGSLACQMAKARGLRVVSSAGTDAKVDWLKRVVRVDHAFNYRKVDLGEALRAACPNGIDVVLENASTEHLCACLPLMKELKQVLIAGLVGTYNSDGKVGLPRNFEFVLDRFLTLQSYRFMDSLDRYDQFVDDMLRWRSEGRMHLEETVYQGLAEAPSALCDLLDGRHTGKVMVNIQN
jgi:NADPH-dependent curcumin reductase CurA